MVVEKATHYINLVISKAKVQGIPAKSHLLLEKRRESSGNMY
jgi:hypothetical protein